MTHEPTPEPGPGDEIGGFRLVRKLGTGARADVYLGYDGTPSVPSLEEKRAGVDSEPAGPSTVAVKIYRPDVAAESISTEVEALVRADHPHAVRLIDLASTPAAVPALILERLPNGSLESLLGSRTDLLVGEAVTILAPIASVVEVMHAGGVAHGRIGATTIFFRESGAPVLEGFGSAELFAPGASVATLSDLPGVRRDRIDLARLALLVLDRVGELASDESLADLRRWLKESSGNVPPDEFPRLLGTRLFDAADGEPVQFITAMEAGRTVGTTRYEQGHNSGRGHDQLPITGPASWLSRLSEKFALPDGIAALVHPVLSAIATVRKPVWIVASTIIAALILALVFIPAPDDKAAVGTVAPRGTDPAGAVGSVNPANQVNPVDRGEEPGAPVKSRQHHSNKRAATLAAVHSLIALRSKCFSELSVGCLDGVDQAGSPAWSEDAADIEAARAGDPPNRAQLIAVLPRVAGVLGDGIIVTLTRQDAKKPASLLLMKGEAGWRIRDYLGAGP